MIVFDKKKKGKPFNPSVPGVGEGLTGWSVEWQHIDGTVSHTELERLKDVKDIPAYAAFSGIIIYRKTISLPTTKTLNLGKVYGESELSVNGVSKGVQWYGRRVFVLEKGVNQLEIRVMATMGNYLKTLTKNPIAQYWTNEKRKDQPIQSIGMAGPVTIY